MVELGENEIRPLVAVRARGSREKEDAFFLRQIRLLLARGGGREGGSAGDLLNLMHRVRDPKGLFKVVGLMGGEGGREGGGEEGGRPFL